MDDSEKVGDMETNINELAQDLEKCCLGNPDVEVIHTGSGFEGLSLPHLDQRQAWNTDADHMIIRTNLKLHQGMKLGDKDVEEGVSDEHDLSGGSERGEGFAAATNMDLAENVLYIYDALHPGYVHASNKKFFDPIDSASVREQCLQNSKFIESSQGLIPLSDTVIMSPEGGSITGPSYSLPSAGGSFTVNRDFVYGLRCESWPSQAEEWIQRDRSHNWPSSGLISEISAQGCHIVPVGSHTSDLREFEWRFSFSVAEMMLARSLTENHKLAYSVLKALIKSEIEVA
ncbi:hypothetical protein OS493_038626 [Desmophyllum pertusum]|uniref:Mab-21-like nucleotidyltransferase domain-containing protein n=1 Tax=Desmophyllum pertusum TaxID=174260 RepID=A0A9W9ZHM3_9CNID|nr:hypothetical protein OS493_038626 [Desmophyllum pertusum]